MFATMVTQAARGLAGSRGPPRFVTRLRLQFPHSAAVPYPRPRNAGRSGSYANTACGSKLAGSTPSSPRRRERPRDRLKQPRGSCRTDQANLVRWYTAAKAATMPNRRGHHFVGLKIVLGRESSARKQTSSLAIASPKMLKERSDEWKHPRFEIGRRANNVNVGKFRQGLVF